jgi:NmrA-like family
LPFRELQDSWIGTGIFVDEMDVARFTIRALSDPRTLNTTVHIRPRDNVLSQNDLIGLWELKTGSKLERQYIQTSSVDEAIKCNPPFLCCCYCCCCCFPPPPLFFFFFFFLGGGGGGGGGDSPLLCLLVLQHLPVVVSNLS